MKLPAVNCWGADPSTQCPKPAAFTLPKTSFRCTNWERRVTRTCKGWVLNSTVKEKGGWTQILTKGQAATASLFSSSVLFLSFVGVMNLWYSKSLKSEDFFTRTSSLTTHFLLQKTNPNNWKSSKSLYWTVICLAQTTLFPLRCLDMEFFCSLPESHSYFCRLKTCICILSLGHRQSVSFILPSSTFLELFLWY